MSASAGRVLILLKGEYSNTTQYQMLDAVMYQGSMYIARTTTIGNTPAEGTYWMKSTAGGEWGSIGGTLSDQTDLQNALDAKQATLTFDTTPTTGSTNPVTSGGVKTVLDTLETEVDAKIDNPSGGTAGQVLRKTATGQVWSNEAAGSWGSITGTLSNQTDLHNALDAKTNLSNVATIESSTTASQAYSVGDYLVLNGQLYEVTTAITSGETLTVGTNITATTVGAELKSLNDDLKYKTLAEYTNVTPSGTMTLSESIENFNELVIMITINNRVSSHVIPVAEVVSNGYGSTTHYVASVIEYAGGGGGSTYAAYAQYYFQNSTLINVIAAGKTQWTGNVYLKAYGRK